MDNIRRSLNSTCLGLSRAAPKPGHPVPSVCIEESSTSPRACICAYKLYTFVTGSSHPMLSFRNFTKEKQMYARCMLWEVDIQQAGLPPALPAGEPTPRPRGHLVCVALAARSWGANPTRFLIGSEALRTVCTYTSGMKRKRHNPWRYAGPHASRQNA